MPALSGRAVQGPRVVVVGDVATDFLAALGRPIAVGSDTPAEIRLIGGGQAANTAAWLAWQGQPVTLAGCVGDDQFGRARLAELTALGVDCAVRRCPGTPTGSVIVLSLGEDRTMITQRGANRQLSVADVDAALATASGVGHLHLSGYVLLDVASRQAGLRVLAAGRERGLPVSVDAASTQPLSEAGVPDYLDWICGVEVLLANAAEAALLTSCGDPESAARALTAVARNVVVKLGAAGALWAGQEGTLIRSPGQRVRVADTTGAGDAFAAGLLAALVAGAEPPAALERASALGSEAVAALGARPAAG